jgi:hypothetical protein
MKKRGLSVQLVKIPGYRASAIHSGKLKEQLEGVTITDNTIIVLQIFDNGSYMHGSY